MNKNFFSLFHSYRIYLIFLFFFMCGTYFLMQALKSDDDEKGMLFYIVKSFKVETSILDTLKKKKDTETELAELKSKVAEYEDKLKAAASLTVINSAVPATTAVDNIKNQTTETGNIDLTKDKTNISIASANSETKEDKKIKENDIRARELNKELLKKDAAQSDVKKNISETNSNLIKQELILIPEGEYIFGAPDKKKRIKLKSFYIDKYEVSNYMYSQFDNSYRYEAGQENFPAVNITYYEALAFAKSQNKRLPTEEEWEKAARGTDERNYPWGQEFDTKKCNTIESKEYALKPVNFYPAGQSPFGVFNMSGNVYEWTTTSQENSEEKVCRGGSYLNPSDYAKTFYRTFEKANSRFSALGFRCVKDLD